MTIEGMHYSENCECEGCKRVSGKSKKIGATSIHQAIAEERARVVEAMMMKGIEAKMTPFQTTVNQYLRNRAEEIGIVLASLDKPLTDKE